MSKVLLVHSLPHERPKALFAFSHLSMLANITPHVDTYLEALLKTHRSIVFPDSHY